MFGLMFSLSGIFIVVVMVFLVTGFIRHARMSRKIFSVVEQELDRQLNSTEPTETETSNATAECAHCGSQVQKNDRQCPQCGGPLG